MVHLTLRRERANRSLRVFGSGLPSSSHVGYTVRNEGAHKALEHEAKALIDLLRQTESVYRLKGYEAVHETSQRAHGMDDIVSAEVQR